MLTLYFIPKTDSYNSGYNFRNKSVLIINFKYTAIKKKRGKCCVSGSFIIYMYKSATF